MELSMLRPRKKQGYVEGKSVRAGSGVSGTAEKELWGLVSKGITGSVAKFKNGGERGNWGGLFSDGEQTL